jgi:hypothetical protein
MAGNKSKMPEFRDEIELQDTGQYGWQRFRKPLPRARHLRVVPKASGNRIDVTPAMDGAYIERWAAEHCLACHVEIESYNAVTARAAL